MKSCRKRILLVEDDHGTQLLLKNMLLHLDPHMRIVAASSAEAAYLALNEAQWDGHTGFDLVVADINLPGSNGLLLWDVVLKRFRLEFLFISGMPKEKWDEQSRQWMQSKPSGQIPY